MKPATLVITLLLAGSFSLAQAAAIPIINAGFEDLYAGNDVFPGTFPTGAAPGGWQAYDPGNVIGNGGFVGVLNPGTLADNGMTFFPNGVPEGDNAALLYFSGDSGGAAYGIEQQLAASLQANTRYLLNVQVGNIATGTGSIPPYNFPDPYLLEGFPGYQVQLLAGGVLLAQDDNSLVPGEGQFALTSVAFSTGQSHAQLGDALMIRLISLNQPDVAGVTGIEVDFDAVELTIGVVPLPPSLWLFLGATVLLFPIVRRNQGREQP